MSDVFHDLLTPMEIVELAVYNISYDNNIYLFTWNPRPNFYEYRKIGNNAYDRQWIEMISVLKDLRRCSEQFCIVPEISDDGKLHCHGWFALTDKIKWLKSVKKRITNNGFMKINKLHTPIENIDYYYKEIDETKEILGHAFSVLTHFTCEEVLARIKYDLIMKSKIKCEMKKVWLIEKLFPNEDDIDN